LNNSSFHKDFRLNGKSFIDFQSLVSYSQNISIEVSDFLKNWFSKDSTLTVQTSGSTGKPKPISLKKEFMINSALATGKFFNLNEQTKALCCLPIKFIAGKMMLVRAMVLGWDLDIVEPSMNPLKDLAKSYQFSAMVPLQVSNSLSNIEQIDTLLIGGGITSLELQSKLQKISTKCYASFGMTETITHIAVKQLNHFEKEIVESYSVLDGVTVSHDDRGCLVIDAPHVSDTRLVTNDVVEIVSEKEFIWKGRFDNVINSGGIKIFPEEVEQKLSKIIPTRFFVTKLSDTDLGERLILIVEGKEDSNLFIKVKTQSGLSKYQLPKEICFLSKFVETETQKINRLKTLELL